MLLWPHLSPAAGNAVLLVFPACPAPGSGMGERIRAENERMNPAPIYSISVSVATQSSFTLLAN